MSRPRSIRPRKDEPAETLLATAVSVCLEVHDLWQRMTAAQRTQVRGFSLPLAEVLENHVTQIAALARGTERMIIPAKTGRVLDLGAFDASGIIRKKSKAPAR